MLHDHAMIIYTILGALCVMQLVTLVMVIVFRSGQTALLALNENINDLKELVGNEFFKNREAEQSSARSAREELNNAFRLFGDGIGRQFEGLSQQQKAQLEEFSRNLQNLTKITEEKMEKLIGSTEAKQNEFKQYLFSSLTEAKESLARSARESRQELAASLKSFEEAFSQSVKGFNEQQKQKFDDLFLRHENLKNASEVKMEKVRETIEQKLLHLQEGNEKKLEEMRQTVDEKLNATVEKRFNESFKLISDRLEQVHKGLGEMQTLATGVGDLKKVLTNVKTRGNLGEIQLGAILEEMFSPEQYEQNAAVQERGQERVEYAIRLPGRNADNKPLLLPIDSKFPNEDYQRLLDVYENIGVQDQRRIDEANRQFENAVRKCARDISEKYINPPVTTNFAIMFVPTEGLYAEIMRRTSLFETIRRENRVTIVGPANLAAFLSSLQMGFKTLAIEKRSSEVWEILGAVKTEFGRFGTVLEKTRKKLEEATNTIDQAGVRSRAIERKLRTVQELPHDQAQTLIGQALDLEESILEPEEELT